MGPVAPVIAAIAPYLGTAATVYGAYNSYQAGKDASKEAELLTDQQMYDERNRTNAEQAERRARAAASGIQMAGSPSLFMGQAKKQDDTRLNYMKRTGDVKSDYLASQGKAEAIGSLAKIPSYWAGA